MSPLSRSRPIVRAAFCAFLLALPLTTAWNLAVAPTHPALVIRIGPKLAGVTIEVPVILSRTTVCDGSFQNQSIAASPTRCRFVRF
jgi:alginate O-acetyltransferase complex protein AlgJ